MKLHQTVRALGNDILVTISDDSGKVLATKVWAGAAKYVRPTTLPAGYICVMVPERSTLDIK